MVAGLIFDSLRFICSQVNPPLDADFKTVLRVCAAVLLIKKISGKEKLNFSQVRRR